MKQVLDEAQIIESMPPVAREMVALMGFARTLEVCRRIGGLKVFVPHKAHAESRLVLLVGMDIATMLASKYGGLRIEAPLLADVARLLRNNAIRADLDAGTSVDELAQRYQLTTRSIWNILKAGSQVSPRAPRPPMRDPKALERLAEQNPTGEPA